MPHFPSGRTQSVTRDLAAILCLALCLLLPRPGIAHPATDTRIDDLTHRIETDPDKAELYLQRGELYREARAWAEAEADYAASRRLAPYLAAVDHCLARIRYGTGRSAEAMALLDRYLGVAPDDAAALTLRARLRGETGEQHAAAEDYDRAIAAWRAGGTLPPPDLYLGRAASLVAAGESFLSEALQGLDDGLELLGHPVTLELEALDVELRLGHFDAALMRVDRRLAIAHRPGPWLVKRGLVLEGAGRYEEALRAYGGAYDDFDARPAGRRQAPAIVRQLDSITTALTRVEARMDSAEGQGDD
jgi:tetratricopeptide (TPR) repeat protein